jgi:uncharacterized repeat protein (TIGR02543 family)
MKGFAFARHARSQVLTAAVSSLITMSIVGVGAYATGIIPASDGTINGCYDRTNGNLRVVATAGDCRTAELPIQWSQRGPRGEQGPEGAQGPRGDTGATGPTGPAGAVASALHVRIAGSGAGSVSDKTQTVSCAPTCDLPLPTGTLYHLTAAAANGPIGTPASLFTGWTGACSGATADCDVAIAGDVTVTASFAKVYRVQFAWMGTFSLQSTGVVTMTSGGAPIPVTCVIGMCTGLAAPGSDVVINFHWDRVYTLSQFAAWTGACAGTPLPTPFDFLHPTGNPNPLCTVHVDADVIAGARSFLF